MIADQFIKIATSGNTVIPTHKLHFLWESIKNSPEGDIIEIGTWKGGSSLVISAAAREFKPKSQVYLCDTFKGIVLAGSNDNYHKDGDFGDTSKQHVQQLLQSYDLTNFLLVEGIFPYDTGHLISSEKISFLHIDVDTYEGYLAILKWAQNRLVENAILVFDDYSAPTCLGAKKAVDEYFSDRKDFEMHLTLGQNSSWARYKKNIS